MDSISDGSSSGSRRSTSIFDLAPHGLELSSGEHKHGYPDYQNPENDETKMIDPSIRLRRAIYHGDTVLVRHIVTSNTRCIRNPDFQDHSNTSLHLAARLGHADIVSYLIDAGHEDECISRNTDGATPLMAAVEAGHDEAAQILAVRFPRCIGWKDKVGMDALMLAARQGSPSMITAFLSLAEDRATLLDATDRDGNIALHFASAFGHLKCVILLLKAGAQHDRMNAKSWQPVHYSSTVSAEVFFKNAVAELEKRRSEEKEMEKELERRKESGVRVVTEDDWEPAPDTRSAPSDTGSPAASSLRGVPVRPMFANRMRSGSAE